MKNYGDQGGYYPSRPYAEADNTLLNLHVKFIFDSVRLGLSNSANILQIADVAL